MGLGIAVPLADVVVQDIQRLAGRRVLWTVDDWQQDAGDDGLGPAPTIIEAPAYRQEVGLWPHQKYSVKTVQLAMAAQLIALTGT